MATAVEEAVAYGPAHRDLEHLTHIGIDEISRKRGHVYVTTVYDLELGLIRFRGHIPKGGYDVHDDQNNEAPASAPAVD